MSDEYPICTNRGMTSSGSPGARVEEHRYRRLTSSWRANIGKACTPDQSLPIANHLHQRSCLRPLARAVPYGGGASGMRELSYEGSRHQRAR